MAREWAKLSHCNRKQVGALIVKNNTIISDGYNGTPSGFTNDCEDEDGSTHWYVLHAEANALLKAVRSSQNAEGATLYVTLSPCKECSKLVIQAGTMSESCDVFVLDMGKSVKIKDLIYKMIKLSGLTIKDAKNLEGDIEVKITGLRPGEKLYEELLIGDNPQKTYHEKIQKAQDPFISFNKLKIELDNLSNLLEKNKVADVKDILAKLVPSYQSNTKIVDHIYEEQLNFKK